MVLNHFIPWKSAFSPGEYDLVVGVIQGGNDVAMYYTDPVCDAFEEELDEPKEVEEVEEIEEVEKVEASP